MLTQFGIEASRAVQFAIAFAIILALLVLLGLVMRKVWGGRLMIQGGDRNRSRQPRLGVVDIYDLDRQRQLVLLRRDNVEHLLLIGGLNDVVIETNIVRVAGARIPVAQNDAGPERLEPNLDQAQRPAIENSGRPSIETQLAAQLGAFIKRPSEESDIEEELAPVATVSAPVPARPEPALKPDEVKVSVAPAPVPAPGVHGLRAEARMPVAPPPPPPAPEARRPQPAQTFTPVFPQRQAAPPPPPPAASAPEVVRAPQAAPGARQNPDAVILSDMAKQLEEALKRPAAPVPPAPQVHAAPQPVHEDVVDEDELLEPAMPERDAESQAEPAFEEDEEERAPPPRPAPEPVQLRPAMEPVRPAPPPPPQAAPAPAAESPAATQKPAQKAPDPFSVEEIEAEFARLLGRPLDAGKRE